MRRRLIGLAALAALSGCWFQPGFDGSNTRNNSLERDLTAAVVPDLVQEWSTPIDAESLSEPIVSGGRVFVTARHPANFLGVKAFRTDTGAPDWDSQVAGVRGGAQPVSLIGDELWLAHTPGFCTTSGITRFDPATGAVTPSTSPVGRRAVPSGAATSAA